MKKIKNFLIAFIVLSLCTGCTINYNLEVSKDTIKETIQVNDTVMDDRTLQDIYDNYQSWYPVYTNISDDQPLEYDSSIKIDDIEYHEKSIQEITNGYYYTYKYTYPIEEFNNASTLRQAFEKRKAFVGDDYVVFKTDKTNLLCNYSYFESIKVNIAVDTSVYKISSTNAHQTNGNVYTWLLDRNNCNDSEISLVLDKIKQTVTTPDDNDPTKDKDDKQTKNNNKYALYIFSAILLLIIFIGYKLFNKMKERNNTMDD